MYARGGVDDFLFDGLGAEPSVAEQPVADPAIAPSGDRILRRGSQIVLPTGSALLVGGWTYRLLETSVFQLLTDTTVVARPGYTDLLELGADAEIQPVAQVPTERQSDGRPRTAGPGDTLTVYKGADITILSEASVTPGPLPGGTGLTTTATGAELAWKKRAVGLGIVAGLVASIGVVVTAVLATSGRKGAAIGSGIFTVVATGASVGGVVYAAKQAKAAGGTGA